MSSERHKHNLCQRGQDIDIHYDSPAGGTGTGCSRHHPFSGFSRWQDSFYQMGRTVRHWIENRFVDGRWAEMTTTVFSNKAFVRWLEEHAHEKSRHACAAYIRQGLETGGLDTAGHPVPAKLYGPFLQKKGFSQVLPTPPVEYSPRIGDIMVIQPYEGGNPAGHVQVWTGSYWTSDFKQTTASKPWPGPGYKKNRPPYAVYRHS